MILVCASPLEQKMEMEKQKPQTDSPSSLGLVDLKSTGLQKAELKQQYVLIPHPAEKKAEAASLDETCLLLTHAGCSHTIVSLQPHSRRMVEAELFQTARGKEPSRMWGCSGAGGGNLGSCPHLSPLCEED